MNNLSLRCTVGSVHDDPPGTFHPVLARTAGRARRFSGLSYMGPMYRTRFNARGREGKKKGGKRCDMAATLHTSLGDIKIELFCDRVPKTCENFLALAASNYYDNTIFHRNIKGSRPHSRSFFSERISPYAPAVPGYYEGPLIHNGNCSCYLPPCIDTLL